MHVEKLLSLPTTSSGCGDVLVTFDGVDLEVQFEAFSQAEHRDHVAVIRFHRVIAHRFQNEAHSGVIPESTYDTVVKLSPSDWIESLTRSEYDGMHWSVKTCSHYAVFLSNCGYLEVIAQSAEQAPSRPGRLGGLA